MEERITLHDIIEIIAVNKTELEAEARNQIAGQLEELSILSENRYLEFTDLTLLTASLERVLEQTKKAISENKNEYNEKTNYGQW